MNAIASNLLDLTAASGVRNFADPAGADSMTARPLASDSFRQGPAAAETTCRVCGCEEVWMDEVMDAHAAQGHWMRLAECPRCDHRWTETVRPAVAISAPAARGSAAPARLPVRPVRPARKTAA